MIPSTEGRGPVVIMYHSITPGNGTPDSRWSVSERAFRRQLDLLKSEGWTTACVRDLARADTLPPRTVVITFDDGFEDNFAYGFRHLSAYGMKATWFVVSGDIDRQSRWSDEGVPMRSMLTGGQLREMAAAGMEIAAHTRTHARLPELDAEKIMDEIEGSKKDLEEILAQTVDSFAYPYGIFNDDCVEAVRKAGYRLACTTQTGWFGSDTDLLRVRRVGIFSDDNLSAFARKVAFADIMPWSRVARYMAGRMRSRFV
jgi:peptidoglycan/xylan/chitin deacetylase (PgdA/CDA1 family)